MTTGIKSSTGYMTKFLPESSNSHPDFSSSTIVMNVLSSGTNDIVSESGVTIGSSTSVSVSSFSPSIQTATYVLISRTDMEEASSSSQWGDGNKQSSVGEEWDDANTVSGDGWSNTCKVESGFEWNQNQTTNISICIKVWGNGKVDSSELWDDGNISNDDGWSNTCQVEQGYACTTIDSNRSNSYCSKIWGNGKINDGEQWDDQNYNLGDGWNSECEQESGYKWNNFPDKPSFWYPIWGDGKRDGIPYNEECDDGNNIDLDGCSGICKVENNYVCSNLTGIDICTTTFSSPLIKSTNFDSKLLQIVVEFDQEMMKQELTDFDMNLDINGPNSPYSVSWTANFDKEKLKIGFSSNPILVGGVNEIIRLQTINVKKFNSKHDISMVAPRLFSFEVSGLPPSDSAQSGGSGASYMFIFIMLLSIGVSLITGGSIELMWSLANTLQIIFFYGILDLRFTPELLATFTYMKYSNFDNPAFEFIRNKWMAVFSFVQSALPSGFGNLGYSSISIIVNFLDKLIMIILFASLVLLIMLIYIWLKKKSNRFANFIKRKDIEFRYEGLSRFIMEILLNLSVVNWINLIYGNFGDLFNIISYSISILLTIWIFYMISYCFIYPRIYYSEILTHPDFHERHCLLFYEFNKDKSRNLYFYGYFMMHRYFFAFLLIWMYNFPVCQCVLIWYLNILYLIYTFKVYNSWLQNFLHVFNWLILIALSACLGLFLDLSNPDKLKISGYVSENYFSNFIISNIIILKSYCFITFILLFV